MEGEITPPSGPPSAPAAGVDPAPGNVARAQVSEISGDHNQIIGQQVSLFTSISPEDMAELWDERGFRESSGGRRTRVTPAFFTTVSAVKLSMQAYDELRSWPEAQTALQSLAAHRIVILRGDRDAGKRQIAKACTVHLALEWGVDAALLAAAPLEAAQKIDLRALAGRDSRLRAKALVLHEVTADRNPDILRLLGDYDRAHLSELSDELRDAGNFLVFTCRQESSVAFSALIESLTVDVVRPPADRLTGLLPVIARRLLAAGSEELEPQLAALLSSIGPGLAERLGTLPRVERFFQAKLSALLSGQVAVAQALDELDRPDPRVIERVEREPDWAACFLALAVTLSGPPGSVLSWAIFDFLRARIGEELQARPKEGEQRHALGSLAVDRQFLAALGVEVVRAENTTLLRPGSDQLAKGLWDYLLDDHRSMASWLRQRLVVWFMEVPSFARLPIAMALSRLAQVDVEVALGSLFAHLATFPVAKRAHAFGLLTQAASLTSNSELKRRCGVVRRLFLAAKTLDRVKAGIKLLGIAGLEDLSATVASLAKVAQGKIAPYYQAAKELQTAQRLEKTKMSAEGATSSRRRRFRELRRREEQLERQTVAKLARNIQGALQVELVGLALELGPIAVCTQLRRHWLGGEKEVVLAPVLAAVLFDGQGILEVVDNLPSSHSDLPSAMLEAIANGRENVRIVGDLFLSLLRHRYVLPAAMADELDERYFAVLERWLQLGSRHDPAKAVVQELWAHLLTDLDPEIPLLLREFLSDLGAENGENRLGRYAKGLLAGRVPAGEV